MLLLLRTGSGHALRRVTLTARACARCGRGRPVARGWGSSASALSGEGGGGGGGEWTMPAGKPLRPRERERRRRELLQRFGKLFKGERATAETGTQLLQDCANAALFKEASMVYQEMQARRMRLEPPDAYAAVVEVYVRNVDIGRALAVFGEATGLRATLTEGFVSKYLRICARYSAAKEAVAAVRGACKHMEDVSPRIFLLAMRACGKAGETKAMHRVLDMALEAHPHMTNKEQRCPEDAQALLFLLETALRAHAVQANEAEVKRVLEQLHDYGLETDANWQDVAAGWACIKAMPDVAARMVASRSKASAARKQQESDARPSPAVSGALAVADADADADDDADVGADSGIDANTETDLDVLQRTRELFNQLPGSNAPPDLRAAGQRAMVFALVNCGRMKEAARMVRQFEEETTAEYSHVLGDERLQAQLSRLRWHHVEACVLAGDMGSALHLLGQYKGRLPASKNLFVTPVAQLLRSDSIADAVAVVHMAHGEGFRFNHSIYEQLVRVHCQEGLLQEAREIWAAALKRAPMVMSPQIVTELIRAYALQSNMNSALQFFTHHARQHAVVRSSIEVWTTVIDALCEAGRWEDVYHYLSDFVTGAYPGTASAIATEAAIASADHQSATTTTTATREHQSLDTDTSSTGTSSALSDPQRRNPSTTDSRAEAATVTGGSATAQGRGGRVRIGRSEAANGLPVQVARRCTAAEGAPLSTTLDILHLVHEHRPEVFFQACGVALRNLCQHKRVVDNPSLSEMVSRFVAQRDALHQRANETTGKHAAPSELEDTGKATKRHKRPPLSRKQRWERGLWKRALEGEHAVWLQLAELAHDCADVQAALDVVSHASGATDYTPADAALYAFVLRTIVLGVLELDERWVVAEEHAKRVFMNYAYEVAAAPAVGAGISEQQTGGVGTGVSPAVCGAFFHVYLLPGHNDPVAGHRVLSRCLHDAGLSMPPRVVQEILREARNVASADASTQVQAQEQLHLNEDGDSGSSTRTVAQESSFSAVESLRRQMLRSGSSIEDVALLTNRTTQAVKQEQLDKANTV